MKILEFAFIGYPVTDLKRAVAFYEGVLGLKRTTTWGDETTGWCEYEVGPHTLAITNMNPDWQPSPHGAAVALEVEDFVETVAHLKQHGVPFDVEPCESPACRLAIISDPDGNKIAIHKRHAH